MTTPKMLAWAWRLKRGPIELFDALEQARIPMVDGETGQHIQWAFQKLPTPGLQAAARIMPRGGEHRPSVKNPPDIMLPILERD